MCIDAAIEVVEILFFLCMTHDKNCIGCNQKNLITEYHLVLGVGEEGGADLSPEVLFILQPRLYFLCKSFVSCCPALLSFSVNE